MHLFDHLRRGQGSITEGLYWAGNLALIVQVAVITLIVTRHRMAAPAAAAGGSVLATGFLAAHWLPEWSVLSDPIWRIDSWAWFSAIASSLEVVGAVVIAVAGLGVIRDPDRGSNPAARSVQRGDAHRAGAGG